jgi:hypothetical protein
LFLADLALRPIPTNLDAARRVHRRQGHRVVGPACATGFAEVALVEREGRGHSLPESGPRRVVVAGRQEPGTLQIGNPCRGGGKLLGMAEPGQVSADDGDIGGVGGEPSARGGHGLAILTAEMDVGKVSDPPRSGSIAGMRVRHALLVFAGAGVLFQVATGILQRRAGAVGRATQGSLDLGRRVRKLLIDHRATA